MFAETESDFITWIFTNYEVDVRGRTLRCRRCHAPVLYVTKHAADHHGDDVIVYPSIASPATVEAWTAVYGPDTARGKEPTHAR